MNRHVFDIMCDKHLRENNIFCLTETHILPNDNTYPIEAAFQCKFLCQFNSSENNFCSPASCSQVSITVVSHQRLDGISEVVFQKEDFSQQPISLIILYRLTNSSVPTLLDAIREFVPEKVNIILGDSSIRNNLFLETTFFVCTNRINLLNLK